MKNTAVPKVGSERSWVRKGLGPKRLISLGPKGLGAETSDIRSNEISSEALKPICTIYWHLLLSRCSDFDKSFTEMFIE